MMTRNPARLKICTCVVLVNNFGSVLAAARKHDDTQFGLPGGKMDPEDGDPTSLEDQKKAAARELREETGLTIPWGDLTLIHEGICVDKNSTDPDTWTMCFAAIGWRHVDPKQQPGEGKVAWVYWDELFKGPFRDYNREVYDTIMAKDGFNIFFPNPRFRVSQAIKLLSQW